MIFAVEQSSENLTGAFILILVMVGMAFPAGFGLCFMLMHRRKGSAHCASTPPTGPADEPPAHGDAETR